MFGTHRHRQHTDFVEPDLPITPMLDMTFQLLAFFIFTFHPQRSEAKIAFGMPEEGDHGPGIPDPRNPLDKPVVIMVEVRATEDGNVASMTLRVENRNFVAAPKQTIPLGS